MMEFSFNTLPRQILITPPLKCVSGFTAYVFFIRKGAFHLNIPAKKDTMNEKNVNISS